MRSNAFGVRRARPICAPILYAGSNGTFEKKKKSFLPHWNLARCRRHGIEKRDSKFPAELRHPRQHRGLSAWSRVQSRRSSLPISRNSRDIFRKDGPPAILVREVLMRRQNRFLLQPKRMPALAQFAYHSSARTMPLLATRIRRRSLSTPNAHWRDGLPTAAPSLERVLGAFLSALQPRSTRLACEFSLVPVGAADQSRLGCDSASSRSSCPCAESHS